MSGKQYAIKKSRKSAVSVANKNMWLAVRELCLVECILCGWLVLLFLLAQRICTAPSLCVSMILALTC